ncbi:sensor histidine kinase [Microbacterium keratanolyticum]|nr:HAMP domain-containing sensor histidine kinase [Microbacterium keratanolyticum]
MTTTAEQAMTTDAPTVPLTAPLPVTAPVAPAPAPERLRTLRTRTLPARWRITAWIILSTVFTMLAVGLIGRSLFLSGVETAANTEIEQEAAEFVRFIDTGIDAGTDEPFASVEKLLADFVGRQSVHENEILVGVVDGEVLTVADGVAPEEKHPLDMTPGRSIPAEMLAPTVRAGASEDSPAGPLRWGRVDFTLGERSGALLIVQLTGDDRAAVEEGVAAFAGIAFAGILLSSGVAWLVAGQILAPVRAVHRVAQSISEHDLTTRVPVEGTDDIAAVATTFNQMLDRLERLHATQQQFVDDAGHELRTPITVVRGQLELLSDDPEERAETLRLVNDELSRMSRIVTDLLVLARAQQPDFVRIAGCDVATLTLDIEAKAQALGDRRWQLMEVAEGTVRLDPQRVTQAVLQLAANAVQVTNDGDRIRIGSRFEGAGMDRRLQLWVQDTGPGVAPDDAERIFERFVRGGARADTNGPTPRSGSGLGLAIVRAITDGHGGAAWVDSVFGEGATFGIDLPAPETDVTTEKGL